MNKYVFTVGIVVMTLALGVFAETHSITGVVTRVSDGDTIWVDRVKVRLDRIDAPEKDQPFGQEATQFLSDRVKGKEVVVEWKKKDQYGRVLGIVYLGTNDVNLAMIQNGMAWHYSHFDKTPAYIEAHAAAQSSKRGLWSSSNPINPYHWRKRK